MHSINLLFNSYQFKSRLGIPLRMDNCFTCMRNYDEPNKHFNRYFNPTWIGSLSTERQRKNP